MEALLEVIGMLVAAWIVAWIAWVFIMLVIKCAKWLGVSGERRSADDFDDIWRSNMENPASHRYYTMGPGHHKLEQEKQQYSQRQYDLYKQYSQSNNKC